MKTPKITIIAAVLALTTASLAFTNFKKRPVAENKGFAVVELYTSEGCSSCPPADELVAKVQKEMGGKPVYILAFHVDYWNNLGWKDVFSSADYSKRQRDYASFIRNSQVYTPQIVVNGKTQFVGSEESDLRSAIKSGLQKDVASTLVLSGLKTEGNKIKVDYRADGSGVNTILLLALVEKSAQHRIKAGENSGRTLSHVQIVRELESISLKGSKSGASAINLPSDFSTQNYELIGFLQDTNSGEIIGASKAQFSPAVNENAKSTR